MGGCYLCGSKPGQTKSNHSSNEQYLRSRHIYISSARSSWLQTISYGSLLPSSWRCVPTRRLG
ncbi:hypothetical protein BCR42DRAFT_429404 [Absidia repens]|uniref:Uncharacterized protein n=1 Tax=Absidia repens TaxID=90262 RepID=A0A1X2HWQ3_9FUNG|nr:hypothetical protein BCR42DRAFT_429404 [Absidia repens]